MNPLQVIERDLFLLISAALLRASVTHFRLASEIYDHGGLPVQNITVAFVHLPVDSVLSLIDEAQIPHQLPKDVAVGKDTPFSDLHGGGVLPLKFFPLLDAGKHREVQERQSPSFRVLVVVVEDVEALPAHVLPLGHWFLDQLHVVEILLENLQKS